MMSGVITAWYMFFQDDDIEGVRIKDFMYLIILYIWIHIVRAISVKKSRFLIYMYQQRLVFIYLLMFSIFNMKTIQTGHSFVSIHSKNWVRNWISRICYSGDWWTSWCNRTRFGADYVSRIDTAWFNA